MNSEDGAITHRKLQKLLYYCQGYHLALEGEPLFEDRMEAWQFGPVCPNIYHKLKHLGYHPISPYINSESINIRDKSKKIILLVLSLFLPLSQDDLIEYSHIDSPWAINYVPHKNNQLSHEQMQSYFSSFKDFKKYTNYIQERIEFRKLIQDRRLYLKNLVNLGDDWLSTRSYAPNTESIYLAVNLLSNLREFINKYINIKIPKLIMGPLAMGGIGLEFIINENKLFINLNNNLTAEVDVEKNSFFTCNDYSYEEINSKFLDIYSELANV